MTLPHRRPPTCIALIGTACLLLLTRFAYCADFYVTPDGAGDKSGSTWANAGNAAAIQPAIDKLQAGQTLFLGSGTYSDVSLHVPAVAGEGTALRTIAGIDTGAGLPLFRSDFDKKNPEKTGKTFATLLTGASRLVVRDLVVDDYRQCVHLDGKHTNVRIENVDAHRTRDGFWIDGGASDAGDDGTRQLTFVGCDVQSFTKRGFRLFNGNRAVRFENCHADAGGKEWSVEPFQICFQVSAGNKGAGDHDITFTDCTAANAYYDANSKYWNGDGFVAEQSASDITWIRCGSFNNTDGGWDIKASRPVLRDCIALQNKRNYRLWCQESAPITLENCLSAYSLDHRSGKPSLGFWIHAGGTVRLKGCTSWANQVGLKVEGNKDAKTKIEIANCLIASLEKGEPKSFETPTDLEVDASTKLVKGPSSELTLKAPTPDWRGGDDKFNASTPQGPGYRYPQADKLRR